MSENPVAVTQALLPVIQADRDAAADYAREHWLWPAPHVEGIRIGSEAWDAYHLTQAFARHRLAGLEREADGAPGGVSGASQFSIDEREDDMLIAERHWQFGWRCIARRPKLVTNDEWRPDAERIVAALTSVSGEVVSASVYEAAVKGRQDFRQAYRELLPVQRAAQALSDYWRTPGAKVDSDEFFGLINDIDVAVTGGGPTTPEMRAQVAGRRATLTAAPEAATHIAEHLTVANATPSAVGGVDRMREALGRAIVFSAYRASDPLAIRFEFATDDDRVAAADAIDQFFLLGIHGIRAALASGETSPDRGASRG